MDCFVGHRVAIKLSNLMYQGNLFHAVTPNTCFSYLYCICKLVYCYFVLLLDITWHWANCKF